MVNISEATKEAFLNGGTKHLHLHIIQAKMWKRVTDADGVESDTLIPEENILADSMKLTQEIISSGDVHVCGCMASKFEIQIFDLKKLIGGKVKVLDRYFVKASVSVDDYTEEIPLFFGVITSVDSPESVDKTTIVAHDDFYVMQNYDMTTLDDIITESEFKRYTDENDTTNSLYPCTLKDFMNSLWDSFDGFSTGTEQTNNHCAKFDPNIKTISFPMDNANVDFSLPRPVYSESTTILEFLTAFCEINCVMAYIDQDCIIRFINVDSFKSSADAEVIEFYKSAYKADKNQGQLTMVIMQNSSGSILYADGDETVVNGTHYIISGNIFTDTIISSMGGNMGSCMDQIDGLFGSQASPYSITTIGMPWVQCGVDRIKFELYSSVSTDVTCNYRVFNRTLSGIQNMTDTFYFDTIVEPYNSRGSIQSRLSALENSRPMTQYVTEKPSSFEDNTIYFVRK